MKLDLTKKKTKKKRSHCEYFEKGTFHFELK